MNQSLQKFIENVTFENPQAYGNMILLPLRGKQAAAIDYLTMKEAMERCCLRITEISEGGSVPDLAVVNEGESFVLLLDGEEVRGAKQNRVLNTSILVEPHSKVVIPVSCTEQGRWAYQSREFSDSGVHMASRVRSAKMAAVTENLKVANSYHSDQGEVWEEVAYLRRDLNAASPTGAMRDAFSARQHDLEGCLGHFPLLDGQQGMLVLLGGVVAGLDLLSKPEAFRQLHAKLVQSYAIDALRTSTDHEPVDAEAVARQFMVDAAAARATAFPSRGHGEDVRLEGKKLTGTALVADDCVVHLALFRREGHSRKNEEPMASWSRRRRYHG